MTPRQPHADAKSGAARLGWQMLLIPLAALIAVMPLIDHGCSCGHDFDFHLLSWMEAARQFAHGNLHPHWAFTPAYNAGEPRFVFYPPISWMLGALLGLLLTHLPGVTEAAAWNAAPIVFTWIALTLSGLTMHRLARSFLGRNAALLAAIVYLANPYMLFTAYERTAYAELLAAAWIPLLFQAILRDRVTATRIAIPVALLWLTNAPAAIMGSYTLAVLAFLRIASTARAAAKSRGPGLASGSWILRHRASLRIALHTVSGTIVGLALAAFYILPAVYERRFVQIAMATIAGMRIDQNFLFEHTGTSSDDLLHDQVLHTASIIAVILLAIAALALVASHFTERRCEHERDLRPFPTFPLAIVAAGIAFLLTSPSVFLWNHMPQASLLQFPWRLLAILAPIAVLALAAACDSIALKAAPTAIAGLVLAVALSHVAYHAFAQPCDPEDTPTARLALFHSNSGTDPTDEYTPVGADNDSLTPGDPPWWLATSPASPPPASAPPGPVQSGPVPMPFTVTAPRAEELILNLRDYPAWRVRINGVAVSQRDPRPDGLIAVGVPRGVSTVDVFYFERLDQTAGTDVSLFTVGLLLLHLRRRRRVLSGLRTA
jgi:hypothetical protein